VPRNLFLDEREILRPGICPKSDVSQINHFLPEFPGTIHDPDPPSIPNVLVLFAEKPCLLADRKLRGDKYIFHVHGGCDK
jgi:hypothetical protein